MQTSIPGAGELNSENGGSRSLREKFIALIDAVDTIPPSTDLSVFYTLLLPNDPRPHGFMLPSVVSRMPWTPPSAFRISHKTRTVEVIGDYSGQSPNIDSTIAATTSMTTASACNAAFQSTITAAITQNLFPILNQRHSEMFRVMGARYQLPAAVRATNDRSNNINKHEAESGMIVLERFAAPLFGIAGRGAHMTAFVRTPKSTHSGTPESEIKIWIARRSRDLFISPGKLDTTVAGGVKASHTPLTCILEEASEEASLPRDLVARDVRATGAVTYVGRSGDGCVSPTVLYCFEIELGEEVVPVPGDEEVERFDLMGVEEVVERMVGGEFKPNCCAVMLDFFLARGILRGEMKGLEERLRRGLPVPIGEWEGE